MIPCTFFELKRSNLRLETFIKIIPFTIRREAGRIADRVWIGLAALQGKLLDLMHRIDKAGAAFQSLGDPLWDTTSPRGRPLSTLLAAIAEFEEVIRERASAGRARALSNGVKFGRKRKLTEHQRQEAIKRRAAGETLASITKSHAVDISMISRLN